MSKKLPKAIRPNVTHQGGPEAQSRVVEPMPETKRPAKPQRGSSIAPEDLLLATRQPPPPPPTPSTPPPPNPAPAN